MSLLQLIPSFRMHYQSVKTIHSDVLMDCMLNSCLEQHSRLPDPLIEERKSKTCHSSYCDRLFMQKTVDKISS